MFEAITNYVMDLIERVGYLGLGLAMFIETFIAPVPSELVLPFAGALAYEGKMNIYIAVVVGAFGSFVGSFLIYVIGLAVPEGKLLEFLDKYGKFVLLSRDDYEKAKSWLIKYGSAVCFFSRLIPTVRSVVSLPAGVARIDIKIFSFYSFVGSLFWSAFLGYLGYRLGENWDLVSEYMSKYEHLIIVLVLLIVIYIFVRKVLQYKSVKSKKSENSELVSKSTTDSKAEKIFEKEDK